MNDYNVKDILAEIVVQTQGFIKDIDCHGIRMSEVVEMIEYLVCQTSKFKTIVLECGKREELQ